MVKDNRPNLTKNLIYLVLIIVVCIGIFYVYSNSSNNAKEIVYTEFESMVESGEVADVYAIGTKVYILTVNDYSKIVNNERVPLDKNNNDDLILINKIRNAFHKNGKYASYYTESPSYIIVQDFITSYNTRIREANPGIKDSELNLVVGSYYQEQESILWTIMPYLSIVLLAIMAFMIIKSINQANSKNIAFGKTKSDGAVISNVKFSDVAGADEEKQELKELVDFLRKPQKFAELGARTPKGVLLVGPPGTGKTLLAKAVAGECNAPFYSISGSDFVEMFVGVGASRVRDLFDKAKSRMPSIIFIDEIDAVGRQRGAGLGGGNDEREQTLNQLLVELDGFEQTDGIIVIAATNRPDVLDPALLRPGRFDRQVYVNLPDVKGREEILKVHARNKKLADDVNLKIIAQITTGFSGADLANLLNEAAILAARDNRNSITMIDINESIDKVVIGPQKRSHVYTEKDKTLTAYHESGHAILHKMLPNCDEVQEVSIIPRGMAGGYTMSRAENDEMYSTYNKMNDEIAAFMGGRVAEELIFKDVSTGASNDIEQATKLARKMVTKFGMSKLGFINFESQNEVFIGRDYKSQAAYSEQTANMIDNEVKDIIDYNYKRATQILTSNIDKLESMAKLLLKKETIYTEQVNMIMDNIPMEEICDSIDKKLEEDKKRIEKEREIARKENEKKEENERIATNKKIQELKKLGVGVVICETDNKQSDNPDNSVSDSHCPADDNSDHCADVNSKEENKSDSNPDSPVNKDSENNNKSDNNDSDEQ